MDFTIITPSRDQLNWLRLCQASVADQREVSVQRIVQDAGSRDGSVEWLRQQSGVEALVEADGGMYDALNRGFDRARGELVAWLNCDEQYLPGALRRVADFFAQHPDVDMLFGDIVMVDAQCEYLCHRKVQPPRLIHTLTCQLSTLSCATFFRRRLVEPGAFRFDTRYRCVGDAEWMARLLRANVRMAALGEFTSVFAFTGTNLSREARAAAEQAQLAATAPAWARAGKPFSVLHHRLRRWLAGAYRQGPFEFLLFTPGTPDRRIVRSVSQPEFRQRW